MNSKFAHYDNRMIQVLHSRAGYGLEVQPNINVTKAALVERSQAQQIAVGNLPMAQQVLPVQLVAIQNNWDQIPIR